MIGNIIARRYAKALFSLAQKAGKKAPAEYGKDLASFVAVLETSPDLLKVFANPIITADVKKAVLTGVLGKLSLKPAVANFLSLLADKERLPFVLDVAATYRALLDESEGVMAFGKFISLARQEATLLPVLPLSPAEAEDTEPAGPKAEYIYEPSVEGLLAELLPRFVNVQLYRGLLDTSASEHGADPPGGMGLPARPGRAATLHFPDQGPPGRRSWRCGPVETKKRNASGGRGIIPPGPPVRSG